MAVMLQTVTTYTPTITTKLQFNLNEYSPSRDVLTLVELLHKCVNHMQHEGKPDGCMYALQVHK